MHTEDGATTFVIFSTEISHHLTYQRLSSYHSAYYGKQMYIIFDLHN